MRSRTDVTGSSKRMIGGAGAGFNSAIFCESIIIEYISVARIYLFSENQTLQPVLQWTVNMHCHQFPYLKGH
jgi:hypothetical protein